MAEGASADEAVRIAAEHLPDVMLLDLSMPGGGLGAVRRIAQDFRVIKTIELTVSEEEDDVTSALQAGAKAYVLKGMSGRDLLTIVRSVAAGEVYVTPALAASLLYGLGATHGQKAGSPLDELTARDRQIVELVAAGDSNKEIAAQLFLSEKTVKHHMTNILQKLLVGNRVEPALLARSTSPG